MRRFRKEILVAGILFLTIFPCQVAFGQNGPLTYSKILTALNATLPKGWTKKRLVEKLITDVKRLKMDKPLTPDREGDLRQAGATDELIDAIRENSPQRSVPGSSAITVGMVRKNSIGMDLVYIPPGKFMMGASQAEIDEAFYECKKYDNSCERTSFTDEAPKHKVVIENDFWMGKYEVTQGQWKAVMGDNPSYFKDCGQNCPVERVSWDDIQGFLRKLNAKNDGFEYSLPTDAQWEYSARAGTTGDYGGTGNSNDMGWYYENSGGKMHPVGQKQPNAWGLYDMHGNVWEWCEDWFDAGYFANSPSSDPVGPSSGEYRVNRGGSWDVNANVARSAVRTGIAPSVRNYNLGFRVLARTSDQLKAEPIIEEQSAATEQGNDSGIMITSQPRPIYTATARQNMVQGTVILQVEFLASGQIGKVIVIKSLDPGLDASAMRAAQEINFIPAVVKGVPSTVTKRIGYQFSVY